MKPLIPIRSIRRRTQAGTKAYWLGRLARRGLPVPNGWAVPLAVHDRYGDNPTDTRKALHEALSALPDGARYAVRSSADVEDRKDHSYAGQFESILDVSGPDALLEAVEAVYESARTVPGAYHAQADPIRMGVLVQEMVVPDLAGVVFTRNPLNSMHETILEMVHGSGEALVQQGRAPLRFVNKWGAWIEEPSGATDADRRVADEVQRGVRTLKARFPGDWDLEWAHDGSRLVWLQMRPITRLQKTSYYSSRAAREFLPGMIRPLVWSVNIPLVNSAWEQVLRMLIGPHHPLDMTRFEKAFHYRAYFNMGFIGDLFEILGLPRETLELIRGNERGGPERPSFRPTLRTLPHLPRLLRTLHASRRMPDEIEAFCRRMRDDVPKQVARIERIAEEGNPQALRRALDELDAFMEPLAYYNLIAPLLRNATIARLRKTLRTAGLSMDVLHGAGPDPALRDVDPAQHLDALHTLLDQGDPATYQAERTRFLAQFGRLRDNNNDFSAPPWRETPEVVDAMARSHAPQKTRSAPQPADARIRRRIEKARRLMRLKETVSFLYIQGYSLYRDLFLAQGRALAASGMLEDAQDVFYLTRQELTDTRDLRTLVRTRKEDFERSRDIRLPEEIFGEDAPPAVGPLDETLTGIAASQGVFCGPSVSARGLQDLARVDASNVLVIPYADISWTPLLLRAGAIVSESGGVLSHSAIVAREFSIPAVLSVPGATSIPDGTTLTVDGATGTILVGKDAPQTP